MRFLAQYVFHYSVKVSKGAKIRNRYNQVPHLTQDTNGKVTNSKLDTTSESQEVSPFPAGDHKAQINRRAQSKLGCKDQESIQSSTTPDPGYQWESNQLTVRHHKRETSGQPLPSR